MINLQPDWFSQGYPHIWLPYAQMKTVLPPLPVVSTQGSRIKLANGHTLIDGLAAWWTACHGYNHPHIMQAVQKQLVTMPHIMFGGLTHEPALQLAHRLCQHLGPGFDRVFFTESGSVAVEVAMKIAIQYWQNQGENKRKKILAFNNAYHGDTFGTMAVSDCKTEMHQMYQSLLPKHDKIELPYDVSMLKSLTAFLDRNAKRLAGILVEPLIQGAGGMLLHKPEILQALRKLADHYQLLLIFDEIFTGFGRTGTMFAFEQTSIKPDIIILSKALTGGTLPLAATVASENVFRAFWSDDINHALMHGPTFMGNALACAAANASLDLFEQEPRLEQVAAISAALEIGLKPLRLLEWVKDIRILGAVGIIELYEILDKPDLQRRIVDAGIWLRPFGNIVYVTPAFTISTNDLNFLLQTILNVLRIQKP